MTCCPSFYLPNHFLKIDPVVSGQPVFISGHPCGILVWIEEQEYTKQHYNDFVICLAYIISWKTSTDSIGEIKVLTIKKLVFVILEEGQVIMSKLKLLYKNCLTLKQVDITMVWNWGNKVVYRCSSLNQYCNPGVFQCFLLLLYKLLRRLATYKRANANCALPFALSVPLICGSSW